MRSLFARVLAGFVVAGGVGAGVVLLANQWLDRPTRWSTVVDALLSAQLEVARGAFERDGSAGLERVARDFARGFGAPLQIADARGRDVLTGQTLATAPETVPWSPIAEVVLNRAPVFTRASTDGQYQILVSLSNLGGPPALLSPQLMMGLAAVVALCWVLARRLSAPVIQLQRTVEQFGQGNVTIRTGSARRDEIGRLARTFDAMADRIEELVEGQRRLLLDISHELRSPLARLTIAAALLRSDPGDEASLQQIETEAERLDQLIGEILQSARFESTGLQRRFGSVDIDRLLVDVADTCRIEATADRRIEVMGETGGVVSGNTELLRRAVENLVRNALRYAPEGTAVTIHVSTTVESVHVSVRDRGPGVPEAALPHLFTPFYRVENDRQRGSGGVGLGLAISRRAVALHGGRIAARNASPGLEVELSLPRRLDDESRK